MNSQKLKSESGTLKQPDYIKKQQQLKAMNKPFVPNKSINADAMIENLLSNKETFQKKKDNPVNSPLPPSWLSPDSSTVSPFYSQLWSLVRMSTGQLADTAAVSSLLMTSGLSTDTLGFIWSLANKTVPGSLTQAELYVVLALVTLAQGGYIFNDTSILNQIQQPPIPKLDLTILPQYNMNFATHSGGISAHYLQQNTAAIDSTATHPGGVSAHHLQSNPAASATPVDNQKQTSPVSIMSLDVNKLQGAPVLTLPNYNFGPFQGFDAAGAVITNSAHAQNVSTYQEPSVSAIPSISLGLSTPTKVNHSFQQSTDISVLDRDLTPETNSEVIAFNNINKFKLDSPTKLPSLSQPVVDVAKNLSNLSLQSRDKVKKSGAGVENKVGNVDDSFDSLSTERASVNPPKPSGPNYNLDLFELSDEVHHVFPDSESGVKKASSNEPASADKQNHDDGGFDDEFTDFQSADFTSFNAATVKHVQKPLPVDSFNAAPVQPSLVDDLLISPSAITQPESNLLTSFGVLESNFPTIIQPELSSASRVEPESTLESNLFSESESRFKSGMKNFSTGIDTELNNLSNLDLNFTADPALKSTMKLKSGLKNLSIGINPELNLSSRVDPGLGLLAPEMNPTTQIDTVFSKNVVDESNEDDDFSGFQAAPLVISDDELFPKTVTINAPNGTRIVDNSFYEKSETNVSEWSDNTSNEWTAGSGGNRSDTERDTDSLNYVDLSDIKLDIPSSDTEEVVGMKPEVKGDDKEDRKEDKYSALRGLQPEDVVATATDEFGDFLAAEPGTEQYRMREMEVNNSAVQIRCLEACLQILQESYSILSSASTPQVLSEVMSDPRTTNHLTCLLEVFRVSERLIKHVENNDLVNQIQSTWNDILPLLEGSKCYQLEDTTGPVCELCRCDYGPFPMKYGRSTFHAPCVNLYLHYVDSNLPNSEAY